MNKILSNQPLFIFVTVAVLSILILSILEYIQLDLLIIPIVLPYLAWLFILMRSRKNR
jgi:cytochrome bd-type quinol oxidase subunit 2